MEKRGFFDIFKRYAPTAEKRQLLESAYDAKYKYTTNPMRVEIDLYFERHYDAATIYEIEDECRTLYNAAAFKIMPHFPKEEFNLSRFNEICYEAALCGAVTHGFFSNAEYDDDGETVTVSLPFYAEGVNFVKDSGTETILSNILFSRYGLSRKIATFSSFVSRR